MVSSSVYPKDIHKRGKSKGIDKNEISLNLVGFLKNFAEGVIILSESRFLLCALP